MLLFSACEKIKIPKDVKPIDWENYNDVYTVYWNCYSSYKKIKSEYEGKTIKISGWSPWWYDSFYLCDDAKYVDNTVRADVIPTILITCYLPGFKEKLDTCDLKKKCFVKGKIRFDTLEYSSSYSIKTKIEVTDINDIYFEK